MKTHTPRVLVSSFAPFRGDERNMSIVGTNTARELAEATDAQIDTVVLPVRFDSRNILSERIDEFKPDAVLMLGQSAGKGVRFEPFARNAQYVDPILGTSRSLRVPQRERFVRPKIDREAPFGHRLQTELPYASINENLTSEGIRSKREQGIGTFVCNSLAYSIKLLHPDIPSGFMHIGKKTAEDEIAKGVEIALDHTIRSIKGKE